MNKIELEELLNKMTLDEKVGQLVQVIGSISNTTCTRLFLEYKSFRRMCKNICKRG